MSTCFGGSISLGRLRSAELPDSVRAFLSQNCWDCHAGAGAEAGLDLSQLPFDLHQPELAERWALVHDRWRAGEMPPPEDGVPQPVAEVGWSTRSQSDLLTPATMDSQRALRDLASSLVEAEQQRTASTGRSEVRRLNRYEFENTLRQLLGAPWLIIADRLPEDSIDFLFAKSGRRLDVSHVHMSTYLAVAEQAIRSAVAAAGYPTQTHKLYARQEKMLQNYLHYRVGQTAATRSIVPLDGLTPEVDVLRKLSPVTVGDADPAKRERESMGVFSGTYSATTKYDFMGAPAATDGLYRLRFKTYTFTAGPWGASGGDDEGLTGGNRAWWRPDRNVTYAGHRLEPVTLYALNDSGESRWLTCFDSTPAASVFECQVALRRGEGIRPDATRLVRTRPGWSGNPNATAEGIPGLAMNWLEIEGPLHPQWPPASYQAVFGQLPFEVTPTGQVKVAGEPSREDARQVLDDFVRRASGFSQLADSEPALHAYLKIYDQARHLGLDFTDAVITTCAAFVCSPEFLYLEEPTGRLPDHLLQRRLAYFLWNGPPDASCVNDTRHDLDEVVQRMLDDPRRERFVNHFLDYWLSLRDLPNNSPDAILYPEYYLDDWLVESSLTETRLFFQELIDRDLPADCLIDSDFTFVNERLADLYALPVRLGASFYRVNLPDDSPRGGLLTQASILRITANGTTTSPVVRGAWIMERLLGREIPPPPSGVAAVEPDIRGATTILQQLAQHRQIEACNACHVHFDPAGIALENFDVCGGWRQRYRATGQGDSAAGFGKNGHAFAFKSALPVERHGTLIDGRDFDDIRQFKQLLLSNRRQIARNLVQRFVTYATGAPVSFADRAEVELILDRARDSDYGVRTLIGEVVASPLFRHK